MIRNHFKRLLAELEFKQSRVITLLEIADATGIHRNTLTRFANDKSYNAGLDVVEKLCRFFNCSVAEMLELVDTADEISAKQPKKS